MVKKISLLLLATSMTLLLASCGGVSQEEYDKVVAERDALQAMVDAQEKLDSIKQDNKREIPATETPSPVPTPEITAPPVSKKVGLNETVTSDRFNITFLNCKTEKKVIDGWGDPITAGDGLTYLIAMFRLENISQADESVWPYSDFEYYADNLLCDCASFGFFPPRIDGYDEFDSDDTLKPGRTMEGYAAGKIPVDTKYVEIEFEGYIFEYEIPEQ